jgi:hypothetical protein
LLLLPPPLPLLDDELLLLLFVQDDDGNEPCAKMFRLAMRFMLLIVAPGMVTDGMSDDKMTTSFLLLVAQLPRKLHSVT